MRVPPGVSLLEDVKNGGLHVIELKFAKLCCDRKNQLRDPDV